jgi:hypothetical protein
MNNPSTIPAPQHPHKPLHRQRRVSFRPIVDQHIRTTARAKTACRTNCTASLLICGNSSTTLVYGSARFFAAA